VGYGAGGGLTEAVRRTPYCVILLDEVEKAHPDVLELFYQVFDKGVMEDGQGLSVDFRNTVIILTSNLGAGEIMAAPRSARPEHLAETVRPVLLRHFPAALLGRLVLAPYRPLGPREIRDIVRMKLDRICRRFQAHYGAPLTYDDTVVHDVAERCTDRETGARNADFVLNHALLPELSREVLLMAACNKAISRARIVVDGTGDFAVDFSPNVDRTGAAAPGPPPAREPEASPEPDHAKPPPRQLITPAAPQPGGGGSVPGAGNAREPGETPSGAPEYRGWRQWYKELQETLGSDQGREPGPGAAKDEPPGE
jgi:hypothetical protein